MICDTVPYFWQGMLLMNGSFALNELKLPERCHTAGLAGFDTIPLMDAESVWKKLLGFASLFKKNT